MKTSLYGDDKYLQQIEIQQAIYPFDNLDLLIINGLIEDPPQTPRLSLPGASGSYASTPGANWTDIDVRARVRIPSWGTGTDSAFAGKYAASPNNGWLFRQGNSGFLEFLASTTGSGATTAAATTKVKSPAGQVCWVRAHRLDSDGSVDFFEAPDQDTEPTVWTSVTPNRTTPVGSIFANTGDFEVGANSAGVAGFFAGEVYRVIVHDTSGIVLDFDPEDYTGGSSFTSSTTGQLFTLNGTSTILDANVATALPYWGLRAV